MIDKNWYERACEVTHQKDATELLETLVAQIMKEGSNDGKTEDEIRAIQISNICYYAGYYDHKTRIRVERLYGGVHPVFGSAKKGAPTPAQAFRLGMEWATKSRRKPDVPDR